MVRKIVLLVCRMDGIIALLHIFALTYVSLPDICLRYIVDKLFFLTKSPYIKQFDTKMLKW